MEPPGKYENILIPTTQEVQKIFLNKLKYKYNIGFNVTNKVLHIVIPVIYF